MKYSERLPSHRAALFAQLGQAIAEGQRFPDVFAEVALISHPTYKIPLQTLCDRIKKRPDVPLAVHLDESPLFSSWETRMLRLGLATLRIPEICGRICDYYVVLEKSSRALSYLVSALLLLQLLCLGGLLGLAWSRVHGWSMELPSLGGLAGILLVLAVAAVAATHLAGCLQLQWSSPDSLLWRMMAQFRQGQSCLVARSLYQYLLNLGLCVQSNFAIERSATLCARAESVTWIRGVYLEIADALKGGAMLSLAFRNSGLLALTSIGPLPPRSVTGGVNQLWSPGITDVVKLSFQQQLGHMLRYVAAMLFLISILILWVAVKLVSGL